MMAPVVIQTYPERTMSAPLTIAETKQCMRRLAEAAKLLDACIDLLTGARGHAQGIIVRPVAFKAIEKLIKDIKS